jgi:transcriptional regulator with XRE-family HTH domain
VPNQPPNSGKKRRAGVEDVEIGRKIRALRLQRGLSQSGLADGIDLTFQQVQKYEKGANRIGASRLQQIANTLQVPISFFFEGPLRPNAGGGGRQTAALDYVSDFLATTDGLALTKAFMRIKDARLRRSIVKLVEDIVGEND